MHRVFVFADASKRYQALEITDNSPKLPAGYLTLAPLLFVPPLWRAVMDPVLLAYTKSGSASAKDETAMMGRRIQHSAREKTTYEPF